MSSKIPNQQLSKLIMRGRFKWGDLSPELNDPSSKDGESSVKRVPFEAIKLIRRSALVHRHDGRIMAKLLEAQGYTTTKEIEDEKKRLLFEAEVVEAIYLVTSTPSTSVSPLSLISPKFPDISKRLSPPERPLETEIHIPSWKRIPISEVNDKYPGVLGLLLSEDLVPFSTAFSEGITAFNLSMLIMHVTLSKGGDRKKSWARTIADRESKLSILCPLFLYLLPDAGIERDYYNNLIQKYLNQTPLQGYYAVILTAFFVSGLQRGINQNEQ